MIYCPQCGTPNKSNSKFCKNCAALLQPSTDIRCPICGTSNPQDAATCKSCGTRLSTSAAGTRSADNLSPADAPESITPFNPPELPQESNAPGDKSPAADTRHAFSRSNSEWLRRIGKAPRPEPPATSGEPGPPPPVESARTPAAPPTDTPEWLRELQADADKAQQAETRAAPESSAPAKPQISEIKLTGDDYDYSDIGGQVTDEMKAQLEAEAATVESVEDEVALARRLLGLDIAAEVVSSATTKPVAPVAEPQEPPAPAAPIAEAAAKAPALEPVQEKQEEASPEWLAALAAASSAAVAANVLRGAEETQAEAESIPTAPIEPVPAAPIAAEAAMEAQVPAAEQAASEPTIEPALAQESIGEAPAPAAPELESGTMPEWLRELAPSDETGARDAATAEGERPAWVVPGAAALGAAALVSHLPDLNESEREELPDWLREPVTPAAPEAELPESAEPSAAERELASEGPLELPAWMQAGAPAGRDLYEVVETTGPLAGVSGILPLAVALTEPHTLSTPTPARSDGGRIFQTILAEPLAPAARAESAPQARKLFTTRHWLYLLVFLAAFIPLFLPPGMDELGLLGKEVGNSPSAVFYDQLSAVPNNSTVLMAFEYTPGQSPELDPAARVILENLIARQASVIALSSNPNGATIAQSLLERAQEAHPEFTFLNLGYIPGNEAGLKNLALGWRRAADVDVNGVPWSQTPLSKKILGMDDFALNVLLLGDNQTLNAWMMQVQPTVKSPLIAATTAAIDPQARVYVNANQLRASLRGLTGAAELELWSGISGRAVKTVNALSFVMLALAGIIIVANVVWLMRRGKR